MKDNYSEKITFNVSQINENGLFGPPDGLRALDYEFCIPADPQLAEAVKSIDPTVKIHPNSPGRIKCSAEEFLCIGNTHQQNFREILQKLAAQNYIKRIDQCFYE